MRNQRIKTEDHQNKKTKLCFIIFSVSRAFVLSLGASSLFFFFYSESSWAEIQQGGTLRVSSPPVVTLVLLNLGR